jgi:putative membrane protein
MIACLSAGGSLVWIIHWLLSALALLLVARVVPGIFVQGFGAALLASVIIGFINATLGAFLKFVTFPLTVLTLGLFWWIINALMLMLAAALVPGFRVNGFGPAFLGAIVLALLNLVLRWLVASVVS